jgi:hypothetical protein
MPITETKESVDRREYKIRELLYDYYAVRISGKEDDETTEEITQDYAQIIRKKIEEGE